MPRLIPAPTRVEAAGNKPKLIDEYFGHVNSGTSAVSIAHMRSPGGWVEPGQTPAFDEYTIVLKGSLRVESKGGTMDVNAGQAVLLAPSTPGQPCLVRSVTAVTACEPAGKTNRSRWCGFHIRMLLSHELVRYQPPVLLTMRFETCS